MRSIGAALLLVLLSACSMLGLGGEEKKNLEITQYGIFKNDQLTLTTEAVPVELGVTFGFRFKYAQPQGAGPVKATVTTSSPGILAPGQAKIQTDFVNNITLEPGREYDVFYTFRQPWEMVSGPWDLKVTTEKGDTVAKTFDVYNPGH
jgi:hypothetical protein